MKSLCIIPARKDSKRLPNKNLLKLNGKSLIEYTLDAAQGNFDTIVVSSDSNEILASVSNHLSQPVLWQRKKNLATDTARAVDAVWDVAYNIVEEYDQVWWMLPTYPLITNKVIKDAIPKLTHKYDSLIVVTEFDFPPSLGLLIEDERLYPYRSHDNFHRKNTRSQDQEKVYRPTGLYGAWTDWFLEAKHFFGPDIRSHVIDKITAWDIDTYEDFVIASMLLNYRKNNE